MRHAADVDAMNAAHRPHLLAAVVAGNHTKDEIFVPGAGPQGGEFYLPYREIRDEFLRYGVELHTRDLCSGREVAFELHVNAQRRLTGRPAYAYLYEDPLVRPRNADPEQLRNYRKLFTWNDELVDGQHIVKLDIPNDLSFEPFASWKERDLFCVMIASNKALLRPNQRNLHDRRVRTARHFEAHAPELFSLYGRGWDQESVRPGVLGRLNKRLREWHGRFRKLPPAFPSWKGVLRTKGEVLRRARFAVCYENVRGSRGYLTEKIFDCFVFGCVPIYLGTEGATANIPADCFIDADRFASEAALLEHLMGIDEARFDSMQRAIADWLSSDSAERFTRRYFSRTIVQAIAADQGLARTSPPSETAL
jgi:hypothetical protein